MLADPLDQAGHLVGDQPDVGVRGAEHRQAGAVAGRRDEEEALVHLDQRLAHAPGVEVPTRALGQAVEAGGHRRQVLGVLPAERVGGADRQAVVGEDHGVADFDDPVHQVVQEPVEFARSADAVVADPLVLDHHTSPSLPAWGEFSSAPRTHPAR